MLHGLKVQREKVVHCAPPVFGRVLTVELLARPAVAHAANSFFFCYPIPSAARRASGSACSAKNGTHDLVNRSTSAEHGGGHADLCRVYGSVTRALIRHGGESSVDVYCGTAGGNVHT